MNIKHVPSFVDPRNLTSQHYPKPNIPTAKCPLQSSYSLSMLECRLALGLRVVRSAFEYVVLGSLTSCFTAGRKCVRELRHRRRYGHSLSPIQSWHFTCPYSVVPLFRRGPPNVQGSGGGGRAFAWSNFFSSEVAVFLACGGSFEGVHVVAVV